MTQELKKIGDKEKKKHIDKIKADFNQIRKILSRLEKDIEHKDLSLQAGAVWISRGLIDSVEQFMSQVIALGKLKY